MKRLLYIIIGVTMLLVSCDKEDSDNGNLDGFWQITSSPGITWASDPYRVDRDSDDVALQNADLLIPYGISDTTTEFYISELTSSRMVLDNSASHLEFRKY